MKNSIAYFQENIIEKLEKIFSDFSSDLTKIAELVQGVTDCMIEFGLCLLAEELESYDTALCEKKSLRPDYYVVRKEKTTLLTSLGTLYYRKTLFQNQKTGTYEYLLDRVMGLAKYARMTEDAEARILEEAVETSYEKGGKNVSISSIEEVSRETVKNKIHKLTFPQKETYPEKKKEVEYLYIEADEDHVSLQFREKKGDIIENAYHQKNNGAIAKLIYVHEGIAEESERNARHKLKNVHYFCRVCEGEENKRLWDEVYEYIENSYDLSKVKKLYLSADGGKWIMSGKRQIAGITYVLDEFHIKKYLRKITRCFGKQEKELEKELIKSIVIGTKKEFEEKIRELKEEVEYSSGQKRIEEGKKYLLKNWTAAKLRLLGKNGVKGSSTEGHVSHVLSERLSSRPMGWSKKGMSKMAELRAYYYNGGDMLELVRYQKQEQPKVVGNEDNIYSSSQMWREERKRRKELGQLAEMKVYSIPYTQIKKIANFKAQIFGL